MHDINYIFFKILRALPSFHIPKSSTANRFKPVFTGTSATLKGRVVEDITTNTPRDCPEPKRRPPNSNSNSKAKDKAKDKDKDKQKDKDSTKDKAKAKDKQKERNEGAKKAPGRAKRESQATLDNKALRQIHPPIALSIGSVGGASSSQLNDIYARRLLRLLWTTLSRDSNRLQSMSIEELLPSTPLYHPGSVE